MTAPSISRDEYLDRQRRAQAAAAERGFDAIVVWGRGGTAADFYGDVLYLSNHMSAFPMQTDNLPVWSARGHSALVLPVGGDPILIVDIHDHRPDLIAVTDTRVGLNVPAKLGEVLLEAGLGGARLGLVGRESLLLSSYHILSETLGAAPDFVPADDILEAMRLIKSPAELLLMREAAQIGVIAMTDMLAAVRDGATEAEIAGEGWRTVARAGGLPYDTAIASGPHSAHFQWARLPSWDARRPLERGDLFHVDLYGPMREGYWVDMARTAVVGRGAYDEQLPVLQGAVELVETVIDELRPGVTFGELWAVGNDWRNTNGFPVRPSGQSGCLVGLDADFPAYGHSVGLGLEGPYIQEGSQRVVAENMVISVETLLSRDGVGGVNFEQNAIVTENGYELITGGSPTAHW